MFKKLFGPRTAPNPKPGPQLCMPALAATEGPSGPAIREAWAKLFPSLPPPTQKAGHEEVKSFEYDGMMLMLAHMPMPIPQGDIDSACERSWMFPEASTEMMRQKSHMIVTALRAKGSTGNAVAEALLVTRAAAAICEASDVAGIYWGNGAQIHKPDFFVDAIKSFDTEDLLPCMLWIGEMVSGEGPGGPFTLTTHGMRCFGHKELEVIDTTMPVGDLRTGIYDTINYLLASGPIFQHGQTFGPTADDKWRIEHTTSRFRKGEQVIRLHIP